MVKIAVCFFGITRSLTYTVASIERNILTPARSLGTVECFGHFYKQSTISNKRSKEHGALRQDEHRLLAFEDLILENPLQSFDALAYEDMKSFGDFWKDDFQSVRNLIQQLHSLEAVTNLAMARSPDFFVFARPDLRYHDSLKAPLRRITGSEGKVALIPSWQHWLGGLNDRFAVCTAAAAPAYGFRGRKAADFCRRHNHPLHSELLLKDALQREDVTVHLIPQRASRIRFNGFRRKEDFIGVDTKGMRKLRRAWNKVMALK